MARTESDPAGSDPVGSDPVGSDPGDETKRKFREALERKQANSGGGANRSGAANKQSHAHGPAEQRRTFRRKSGG